MEGIRKIIKNGKEDNKRLLAVSVRLLTYSIYPQLLSSLTTSCAQAAPEIGGKTMQETIKKLILTKAVSNETE